MTGIYAIWQPNSLILEQIIPTLNFPSMSKSKKNRSKNSIFNSILKTL